MLGSKPGGSKILGSTGGRPKLFLRTNRFELLFSFLQKKYLNYHSSMLFQYVIHTERLELSLFNDSVIQLSCVHDSLFESFAKTERFELSRFNDSMFLRTRRSELSFVNDSLIQSFIRIERLEL